jgi:ethanolamine ammonia-lyase small subunit
MTEKQVRDIVKSILRSQSTENAAKLQMVKIAKEEAEKAANKVAKDSITNDEVKDIIKKTMHSYHKWMWEKKGMWMNQI